jgi:hypothetical protein
LIAFAQVRYKCAVQRTCSIQETKETGTKYVKRCKPLLIYRAKAYREETAAQFQLVNRWSKSFMEIPFGPDFLATAYAEWLIQCAIVGHGKSYFYF